MAETFYSEGIDKRNQESRKEFQKRKEREKLDLQKVLKLPEGRRLIYKILSDCGVFRASFALSSMQTAFNEGKRDVGLGLLGDLDEAEPNAYSQMLSEHFSELKSKKQDKKEEE